MNETNHEMLPLFLLLTAAHPKRSSGGWRCMYGLDNWPLHHGPDTQKQSQRLTPAHILVSDSSLDFGMMWEHLRAAAGGVYFGTEDIFHNLWNY